MELQDDLMRSCSVCNEQISKQAEKCPNCGQDYVAWTNPETKEVEYITPDELKEKPQTTSQTVAELQNDLMRPCSVCNKQISKQAQTAVKIMYHG